MKRRALVAAAIVVLLPASGSLTSAFGNALSTPGHHHERVRHHLRSVGDPAAATAAQRDSRISPEKHKQLSAAEAHILPDANARIGAPSAEWDCSGGDAGCSWEPNGWRSRN